MYGRADGIGNVLHQDYLSKVTSSLVGSDELELVWQILLNHCEPASSPSQVRTISYLGYLKAVQECQSLRPTVLNRFLNSPTFLRLKRSDSTLVSVDLLFQQLIQRASSVNLRCQLARFDSDGDGFLTSHELWTYVAQTASQIPSLSRLNFNISIHDYADVATSKLLFFHKSRGKVNISELLSSKSLKEFLSQAESADPGQEQSWFSIQSVASLRELFKDLDKDGDGLLSVSEFAGLSQNTMSPLFISRVYERYCAAPKSNARTLRNFMKFADFIRFVVAWDHRHTPQGIQHFFSLLDFRQRGHISEVEVYIFFKEIHRMWVDFGQYEDLKITDVVNEIIDILKPADRCRITPRDFLRSGMGGVLLGILADVNLFWEYENRESLTQQQQPAPDDGSDSEVI